MIGEAIGASLIGALDGVAASADTNAGRSWGTPGMVVGTITPVVKWGWGPAVQGASVGVGAVLLAEGKERAGTTLLVTGEALLMRAIVFSLFQRRRTSPAPTQADVWQEGRAPGPALADLQQPTALGDVSGAGALRLGAPAMRAPGSFSRGSVPIWAAR